MLTEASGLFLVLLGELVSDDELVISLFHLVMKDTVLEEFCHTLLVLALDRISSWRLKAVMLGDKIPDTPLE